MHGLFMMRFCTITSCLLSGQVDQCFLVFFTGSATIQVVASVMNCELRKQMKAKHLMKILSATEGQKKKRIQVGKDYGSPEMRCVRRHRKYCMSRIPYKTCCLELLTMISCPQTEVKLKKKRKKEF